MSARLKPEKIADMDGVGPVEPTHHSSQTIQNEYSIPTDSHRLAWQTH